MSGKRVDFLTWKRAGTQIANICINYYFYYKDQFKNALISDYSNIEVCKMNAFLTRDGICELLILFTDFFYFIYEFFYDVLYADVCFSKYVWCVIYEISHKRKCWAIIACGENDVCARVQFLIEAVVVEEHHL